VKYKLIATWDDDNSVEEIGTYESMDEAWNVAENHEYRVNPFSRECVDFTIKPIKEIDIDIKFVVE